MKITPDSKKEKEINELFKKQNILKSKTDEESKNLLKEIEEKLEIKLSEELFGIVKEEVKKNSETGGFNSGHLWQLKKKIMEKLIVQGPQWLIIKENLLQQKMKQKK